MTTTHSDSVPTRHRAARTAAAVSGLGAVATALVLAAPGAGAVPQNVGADPGSSVGLTTPFGTACSYQVRAAVDNTTEPVTFSDNGVVGGAFNPPVATPNGTVASTTWTPPNPGTHVIAAEQGGVTVTSAPIQVGTGINAGTGCAVP